MYNQVTMDEQRRKVFLADIRSRFNMEFEDVVKRALDLDLPMKEMLTVLYLYKKEKYETEKEEEMFLADAHRFGVAKIFDELRAILADVKNIGNTAITNTD